VRKRLARQQADARVMAALGQVVAHLQTVFAPTEFARGSRGEIVRKRQENLRAKVWSSVRQLSPGRVERSELNALGGDDGNAFGLARKTEELPAASAAENHRMRRIAVMEIQKVGRAVIGFERSENIPGGDGDSAFPRNAG